MIKLEIVLANGAKVSGSYSLAELVGRLKTLRDLLGLGLVRDWSLS